MRENRCPRCEAQLKSWDQLNSEEREVVARLPDSIEHTPQERKTRQRWCTRCWLVVNDRASGTA